MAVSLRAWQESAQQEWVRNKHTGIVEVVTGGGKTVFALSCIERLRPETTLVVVPSLALLDQWWEEAASYFHLSLDEIHMISGGANLRVKPGTINIAVLNTAARIRAVDVRPCFLIVDECHKAASSEFRRALDLPKVASLGLSATPDRPYDEGLADILVPALGPIVYRYTYVDAVRDGVVVPFSLRNIVFSLEDDRQREYDRLTARIARSVERHGPESQEAMTLLLRRARLVNLSLSRVRLTIKLVASNRRHRTLVFHEDIEACNLIDEVLRANAVRSGVYHSRLKLRKRAEILQAFRQGSIEVLVTCRALDEGFNVPEADLGIIAASTATRRQRIQRLGRILRPSPGKQRATVYSLVATEPEIARLKDEEAALEGTAEVFWSRA